MNIIRRLQVPTGDILVVDGDKGSLEMLSLGDYGKDVNVKADFMGLCRPIDKVEHTTMLPLEEKWVITISTQYGCSMRCPYCDVPKVGPGKNATINDLIQQVLIGVHIHPEVIRTKRLNIHFARMGEPSWNPNVLDAAKWFRQHLRIGDDGDVKYEIHPVVSTMMPKNNEWLKTFIHTWVRVKNRVYDGNAGLQISVNSTDDKQRDFLFSGNACSLHQIASIMDGVVPFGRKITLNFAVADGFEIDSDVLLRYFNPEYYLIKLTPMHKTNTAISNGIETKGDYTTMIPYIELEQSLKKAGYDVIVFVASHYEDMGRITCGNAILSGSLPEVPYTETT